MGIARRLLVSLVAVATMLGLSVATPARAVTSTKQLASAPIPSMCGHAGGRLRNGKLPYKDGGGAYLVLQPPVVGQTIKCSPLEAVATIDCSQGGVGWPDHVVFYDSKLRIIGHLDTGKLGRNTGRSTIRSVKISKGVVTVMVYAVGQKDDYSLWGTMAVRLTYSYDAEKRTMVRRSTKAYTETATAKAFVKAINDRKRSTALKYGSKSVTTKMLHDRTAYGFRFKVLSCNGASYFSDWWGVEERVFGRRGCRVQVRWYSTSEREWMTNVSVLVMDHPSSGDWTTWRATAQVYAAG